MIYKRKRRKEIVLDILFVILVICCAVSNAVPANQIKVGVMHSGDSKAFNSQSYRGAITRAFDDVNNSTSILNETTLKYVIKDSDCKSQTGIGAAVDLYNDGVKAFIGPPCSKSCLSAGLLSTNKQIPMISYSCSSIELSNKKEYPYFARTKSFSRTSKQWTPKAFIALINLYNWKKVCMIERIHEIYTPISEELRRQLQEENIDTGPREVYDSEETPYELKKIILERLRNQCRIIVIISRATDVTEFLVQAYHMGLLRAGHYVFLTTDFYITSAVKRVPDKWNLPGQNTTERFDFLMNYVLEGLIYISVVRPNKTTDKFTSFANDVRHRLTLPPFNDTGVTSTSPSISTTAGFLYDAVMILAKAFDRILRAQPNSTLDDAAQIYKEILNTTDVDLFTGPVLLDQNGDRIPVFVIGNIHDGVLTDALEFDPFKNQSITKNIVIYFPTGTTKVPRDIPECGFLGEKCPTAEVDSIDLTPVYVIVPIIVVIIVVGLAYLHNKKRYEMEFLCKHLLINIKEISSGGENSSFKSKISAMSGISGLSRSLSRRGSSTGFHTQTLAVSPGRTAVYNSERVFVKTIRQCKVDLTKIVLLELKKLKDINHTNVNPFIGALQKPPDFHTLWIVCSKGSLQDVLQNDDLECDWTFRLSFVSDIAKGLNEIHKIGIHGNLTSSNCLVDNRWVCKISNFGLTNFRSAIKSQPETYELCRRQFWTAPEHLANLDLALTKENDIYSYGIILYEISSREDPYSIEMEEGNLQPKDIIDLIKTEMAPPYRPSIITHNGAPEEFNVLMTNCWEELPTDRCVMKTILRTANRLYRHHGMRGSLVDHMLTLMEKYTNNLEDIVADRTKQLEEEKIKTETLLYKMLPVSVANILKEGQPVLAEQFTAVTIFFSDIVGFTALCSGSEPIQVVEMLNDLYSCFDNIIDSHDVYKVETIGDAYMVVSGLPIRNENRHGGEIATMSLDLLSSVEAFKVKHRPDHQLQLRIGIHTGPCVAGVVGLKMPRYCLFGDTVNYASRMESSGLALRIHVSPECKTILDELDGYVLEERGPVEMKGKGTVVTFFLKGKEGYTKILPDLSKAAKLEDHAFK